MIKRKHILLFSIALALFSAVWFGFKLFVQNISIIQNGIGFSCSVLLTTTFSLLWLTNKSSKIIKKASTILGITISSLIILSYLDASLILSDWNLILSLIALLSGIVLMSIVGLKNKLAIFFIALLTITLEIMLLFKTGDAFLFTATILILIIVAVLSLFSVFTKKQ